MSGRSRRGLREWMARALRCPSDPAFIGSQMNYPYWQQWAGGGTKPAAAAFAPACPMLYVYGTKKPFMFHSPAWAEALATRPGCAVLALETGHWVMNRRPEPFNQALLAWLGRARPHPA
jgi:pimeloyl-ACP methyl ester carboxylesterase